MCETSPEADSSPFYGFTSVSEPVIFLCFFSLFLAGVWLLFNGLLVLLFSLFYVTSEIDKLLHSVLPSTLSQLQKKAKTRQKQERK